MPTLTELLKAEGIDVPESLSAKLPTLLEASDEVRAMSQAKDELLKWKQDNKPLLESLQSEKNELDTKYNDELNERMRVAKENDDFKTQLEIIQEREKKQAEQLEIRNKQAKHGAQESAELQVAGLFKSQEVGRLIAKNYAVVDLSDDGSVNTTYNLNGESFTDFNLFKAAAEKVDYLASQMAGPQSSGPSGKGGHGGGGGKKPQEMNSQERLEFKQRDPAGFKLAFNL